MKQLFVLSLFFLSACTKTETEPAGPTGGQPSAHYVQGKVTDTQGQPIAGARIIVDNTMWYNSGTTGTTDANGNYKIGVENGSWRVYAEIDRTFHGKQYKKLELHPDSDNAFAGADGGTVNFQWKLSGEKPAPMAGYYGATANLFHDTDNDIRDVENIEFTFTPVGDLVDGNPGEVLTLKSGQPLLANYSKLTDIPIGQYRVTARHLPTGKTMKLKLDNSSDAYVQELLMEFEPEYTICSNCVTILYSDH